MAWREVEPGVETDCGPLEDLVEAMLDTGEWTAVYRSPSGTFHEDGWAQLVSRDRKTEMLFHKDGQSVRRAHG